MAWDNSLKSVKLRKNAIIFIMIRTVCIENQINMERIVWLQDT